MLADRGDAAGDQGAVLQLPDPHRHVIAAAGQVDGAVLELDVQLDAGMGEREIGQSRSEMGDAESVNDGRRRSSSGNSARRARRADCGRVRMIVASCGVRIDASSARACEPS